MDPMELDPEKNPSPYGASSEPPLDEAQAMLDESEEIAANLTTDWEPSGLPAEVFATKESGGPWTDRLHDFWYNARNDRKHLSDADQADLARENATIRENVVAAGSGPHHFKPAEWTHPNGHPRCILCGAEERTDGMCTGDMVPTGEDARSPSRPKEAKGDAAGHEFHGNRYTGGIGSGFKEPGDPAPGSFRLYHGTTVAAVEMAKAGSGYVRNDPARVAGEVERHFKLPSGSVANHPHFFPNGVQRAINAQRSGKPLSPVHDAVYLTPNREFARYYSQLGSETVHDAIRAATEVRAASGTLTPEERVAMYDDYKKDQVGVVLHVDVPASAFPSKLDMMSGESLPVTPAEFMQRLRSGGELRLKSIPHEYVRAIEVPDPNKPIDLNKPAAYYGDKASWSVDSKGDVVDVKYSDSEDRDDSGRWTSGGGDATATVPDVSGNAIHQGQHVFDVASGKPGTVFAVRPDASGSGKHLAMVHMAHFRNAASPTGVHIVFSRSLASSAHEAYQKPEDLAAIRLAQATAEHQFMGANEYAQRDAKGDASGHPFHGNRYTGGLGGGSAHLAKVQAHLGSLTQQLMQQAIDTANGGLTVAKIQAMGSSLKPEQIEKIMAAFASDGKPPPKDTSMTDRHPEYGNLTGEQAVALASYQRSGYAEMNDRLRAGSPPITNEYTGEHLVEEEQWRDSQIKAIDDAMEPLKNETILYRAIGEGGVNALIGERQSGAPRGEALREELGKLVGTTIEDKAYTSTTTDKESAGARVYHGEVVVQVTAEPGVGYIDMNAHHLNDESYVHEKEILLARGGKYEITGVSDKPTDQFGSEFPVYVLQMRRVA